MYSTTPPDNHAPRNSQSEAQLLQADENESRRLLPLSASPKSDAVPIQSEGEIWQANDGGFRHLEILHIGRTDLKIWLASPHHFPRLKHVELKNCKDLQQIPVELAEVPSFVKLDVFRSERAAASARKIEAKTKDIKGNVARQFRLSIFPPEA